jgi:hypothetical protein
VRNTQGQKTEEWLFNLESDSLEKTNLLASQPDSVSRLQKKLADWELEVKVVR